MDAKIYENPPKIIIKQPRFGPSTQQFYQNYPNLTTQHVQLPVRPGANDL